jgi:hypothetical protein
MRVRSAARQGNAVEIEGATYAPVTAPNLAITQ